MKTPVTREPYEAEPELKPALAHGYVAVRCGADIEFLTRSIRILGADPVAWRALEERPPGIGSWLVEVAYLPMDVAPEEPAQSGVFRSQPRHEDTEWRDAEEHASTQSRLEQIPRDGECGERREDNDEGQAEPHDDDSPRD